MTSLMSIDTYNRVYKKEAPCEVIDGEIVPIPIKGFGECIVRQNLANSLHDFLGEASGDSVFIAIVTLLDADQKAGWVREARKFDVSIISRAQLDEQIALYLADDALWQVAPLIAVDVVSPYNSDAYITRKISDCLHNGVRQVWMIRLEQRSVTIHSSQNVDVVLTDQDILTGSPLINGWSMPVAELFEDL